MPLPTPVARKISSRPWNVVCDFPTITAKQSARSSAVDSVKYAGRLYNFFDGSLLTYEQFPSTARHQYGGRPKTGAVSRTMRSTIAMLTAPSTPGQHGQISWADDLRSPRPGRP